jgi:hypothetical protein
MISGEAKKMIFIFITLPRDLSGVYNRMTTQAQDRIKIKAILKLKAPEGKAFYTKEEVFIRWCMYITKHLPYLPVEIWAIIFKKVQLFENDYHLRFIYPQQCKERFEKVKRRREEYQAKRLAITGGTLYPCREYKLSTKTFRAYYVEQLHREVVTGCPYLYMDKKHNVKQCQWDKLGKEIKSYKLPRFVLDY